MIPKKPKQTLIMHPIPQQTQHLRQIILKHHPGLLHITLLQLLQFLLPLAPLTHHTHILHPRPQRPRKLTKSQILPLLILIPQLNHIPDLLSTNIHLALLEKPFEAVDVPVLAVFVEGLEELAEFVEAAADEQQDGFEELLDWVDLFQDAEEAHLGEDGEVLPEGQQFGLVELEVVGLVEKGLQVGEVLQAAGEDGVVTVEGLQR
jgi:hypothetical protein